MNRIITKTKADAASIKIAGVVWDAQIQEAKKAVNAECERLARKYIPAPVLACVAEYGNNFVTVKSIVVTAYTEPPKSIRKETCIVGILSFWIPKGSDYMVVDHEDYKYLRILYDGYRNTQERKATYKDCVMATLLSLRTEKRVMESFPEALEYIDFPSVKALPSVDCSGLRRLLNSMREEESNT